MSYLSNFNYQILGNESGGKLVFLHGLMGNLANWRRITPSFVKDHCILIFDQRGHGRSFHPFEDYYPEDFANDLVKILEELNWGSVRLVGHSMGGRNALNLAYRYPELITQLVIEDIAPVSSEAAVQRIKHLLGLVPVPFPSRRAAKEFFDFEFPKLIEMEEQPGVLSQYFYTNIVEKPSGEADWRFSLDGVLKSVEQGREANRWEEVKGLRTSTLLIRGEKSQELSSENFEKMTSCNKKVQGVEIPGAGHWVHNDAPEEFCRVIKEFFFSAT